VIKELYVIQAHK